MHYERAIALLEAEGNSHAAARVSARLGEVIWLEGEGIKLAFVEGTEAALALGDWSKAQELISRLQRLPVGQVTPSLTAQANRLQGLLHAAEGREPEAEACFRQAVERFHAMEVPFGLGVTLVDYGEWLTARRGPEAAAPLLEEAGEIFRRMPAERWLERVELVATEPSASP